MNGPDRSLLILALGALLAAPATALSAKSPAPKPGKYGCSESVFSVDGYQIEPRGFITLYKGNTYRQGTGKKGTTSFKNGVTRFKGGGLDKSTAKAIDGKSTRFQITVRFTDGKTARWSCTHT